MTIVGLVLLLLGGVTATSLTPTPGTVTAITFSPSGEMVAATAATHDTHVWEAGSGRLLFRLANNGDTPTAVQFSTDSRLLILGFASGSIVVRDLKAGRDTVRLTGHTEAISALAASSSIHDLSSASRDGTIRRWELVSGAEVLRYEPGNPVTALALASEGRRMAIGCENGELLIWETDTRRERARMDLGETAITSVACNTNLHLMVAASGDGTILGLDEGKELVVARAKVNTAIPSLAMDPVRPLLFTGTAAGSVSIWELPSLRFLKDLTASEGKDGACIDVNGAGTMLASGGDDGTVRLWDLTSGTSIRTLAWEPEETATTPNTATLAWARAFTQPVVVPDGNLSALVLSIKNTGKEAARDIRVEQLISSALVPVAVLHPAPAIDSLAPDQSVDIPVKLGMLGESDSPGDATYRFRGEVTARNARPLPVEFIARSHLPHLQILSARVTNKPAPAIEIQLRNDGTGPPRAPLTCELSLWGKKLQTTIRIESLAPQETRQVTFLLAAPVAEDHRIDITLHIRQEGFPPRDWTLPVQAEFAGSDTITLPLLAGVIFIAGILALALFRRRHYPAASAP